MTYILKFEDGTEIEYDSLIEAQERQQKFRMMRVHTTIIERGDKNDT